MKTWQTLSGPFTAANGLTVATVGTDAQLENLGHEFRNGLMVDWQRDLWADLCMEGNRQIFAVADAEGAPVANGELKVQDGRVRVMFVRGRGNAEFAAGQAAYDAAADYAVAVNDRRIEISLVPHANGFSAPEPQAAPESRWERALRFARERMISPFAAMVLGDAAPAAEQNEEPAVTVFEDIRWVPLSAAWTSPEGITVEPVSARSGLRRIGKDLENNLYPPLMTEQVARGCADGASQYLALYTEAEGIVGYAEIQPVMGQVVRVAARGFADGEVSAEASRAVSEYVALVNGRLIELNVAFEGNSFGEAEDLEQGRWVGATLPRASRGGAEAEFGIGDEAEDGRDPDLDDEEGLDDGRDEATSAYEAYPGAPRQEGVAAYRAVPVEDGALAWEPITDEFVAPNGLVVTPVTDEAALAAMGVEFDNALASMHSMWARKCVSGESQIVRITVPGADGPVLVANAELSVQNGRIYPLFNRAHNNQDAGYEAQAALAAYLIAVNNGRIELLGELADHGFRTPGMPERPAAEDADDFVEGHDDGNEDRDPPLRWTGLTDRYVTGNLTIVPVTNELELIKLGEDYGLPLDEDRSHEFAERCVQGRTQFLSILDANDEFAALAQVKARTDGTILEVACMAENGDFPSDEAAEALRSWCILVDARRIPLNGEVGEFGFTLPAPEGEPLAWPDHGYRAGGYAPNFTEAYPGAPRVEGHRAYTPRPFDGEPIRWTAFTEAFVAPNGLTVEPVTDQAALRDMGVEFDNALATMHEMWAHKCERGESQIVRIVDADGNLVSNAELHCHDGVVREEFNRGKNNATASQDAQAALDAYCRAATIGEGVVLLGAVQNGRFNFPEPQPGPGM
jgi:hypothetical protein